MHSVMPKPPRVSKKETVFASLGFWLHLIGSNLWWKTIWYIRNPWRFLRVSPDLERTSVFNVWSSFISPMLYILARVSSALSAACVDACECHAYESSLHLLLPGTIFNCQWNCWEEITWCMFTLLWFTRFVLFVLFYVH